MKPLTAVKSPKTSTVAIGLILSGLGAIAVAIGNGEMPNLEAIFALLTGVGFWLARDDKVTDEEAGAVEAAEQRKVKQELKTKTPRGFNK